MPDTITNRRCGQLCPGDHFLNDAGLDDFEQAALHAMRLFFATMAHQLPPYAPEPGQFARDRFGTPQGDQIMAVLVRLVQTMAISRRDCFRYSNPFCADCARVMTPTEWHLMKLLHHARRGGDGSAMVHALMLCDIRPVGPLIEAAHAVAQMALQTTPNVTHPVRNT